MRGWNKDIFYRAVANVLGVNVVQLLTLLGWSEAGTAGGRRGPCGYVRGEDIVRARELLRMNWDEYGRFLDKLLK